MMHMTLYWGIQVTLLFDSWTTQSWLGYLLTLLVCFLFSSFYQYMEDRRIRFKAAASSSASTAAAPPSEPAWAAVPLLLRKSRVSPARVATAVLFGVNSAIGYLLMLAIMSFNGGVLVAIVSGLSVGYFLFRSGDEKAVVAADENPCACA